MIDRFPKMSLNRLLIVWLAVAAPLFALVAFALHAPGPALLVLPLAWIVLRHLNRRAWKRHFTPRRR